MAIGVLMSICLFPPGLVPYVLFAFAIRAARRVLVRVTVLLLILLSVCVGFWCFWDAAFIHLSTLNLIPLEVAVVESLLAGGTWLVVRNVEKIRNEHTTA
jgi:hypothetical protein